MLLIMKKISLGFLLGIFGYIDWKKREVPVVLLIAVALMGMGFCILERRPIESVIYACVPGILMLIFSKISRESMGYGDGLLLLGMGAFLTYKSVVVISLMALGIGGIIALVLVAMCHKKGNFEIPFIPFLTLSYMIWMAKEMGI